MGGAECLLLKIIDFQKFCVPPGVRLSVSINATTYIMLSSEQNPEGLPDGSGKPVAQRGLEVNSRD